MPRIGSGIPLVGRSAELAVLRSALQAAADGRANAVLLSGDAGVGKSRLLAELLTAARTAGATVFTGRCLDVDEAGLPYLPFVEALGQLTEAQRQIATRRPVLNRMLPGLAPTAADVPAETDSAMEQLRLFDAVHGLLSDLAAVRTVVLAVEDLHWADASTRDLILFLVSRLHTQRVLLVCTYRVDDLHRRHPMRPLLGELSRSSTVDIVPLDPFDQNDSMTFVAALADGSLPLDTVREIARKSEGNAFFCEELTAAYGDGAGVPSGLADLLLARVERLSGDARKVVRAASVACQTATHDNLLAVSGLPGDVLEEALRESVQHNVLVTADGGYTFRHALSCEAVYDDLLPGERVRLHAGYAKVVSSQAMLAYHSLRSHDLPCALAASVRAAEKADEMGAPGEKLRHLEQALELWTAVPRPAQVSGTDELSLLGNATKAASATGEADRAVRYAKSAMVRADGHGHPELSAQARQQLVLALLPFEHRDVSIRNLVAEAWELVRDRPPSEVKARVLSLRARSWVWEWQQVIDLDEVRRDAEAAIHTAKLAGATAVEVDALVTLAVVTEWRGEVDAAILLGWAAADRAAQMGAYDVELRARKNIAVGHMINGRLPEALRLCEQAWQRAVEVGLPWSVWAMDALMERIHIGYVLGDWAGALAAADVSSAPRLAAGRVTAPAMWILAAQGEFERVHELADRLDEQTEDAFALAEAGVAVARALQWQGRHRDAAARVQVVFDLLESLSRPSIIDAIAAANTAVSAMADLAEQARLRRDNEEVRRAVEKAEQIVARMQKHAQKTRVGKLVYEERSPLLALHKANLTAELSRLRGEDDPRLWQDAVEQSVLFGYAQACTQWRWAVALLAAGAKEKAAEQLLQAYAVATEMGARPLAGALAALARRGRIPLPGNEKPPEPVTDLTPRELAVLELVANGLTNKQVGAQLYISRKTASVHLSRAMAKLGAANRTELVSIAHDRGLLS